MINLHDSVERTTFSFSVTFIPTPPVAMDTVACVNPRVHIIPCLLTRKLKATDYNITCHNITQGLNYKLKKINPIIVNLIICVISSS